MKRIFSGTVFAALALAFMVVVAPGCRRGNAPQTEVKKKMPPLVMVEPAAVQDISNRLNVTGEVVALNRVTISATVDGPVACCAWNEGDTVKRGEKLIEIDRSLYGEEVKTAEASLKVIRARYEDMKAGRRPEEIAQQKETVRQCEEELRFEQSDLGKVRKLVTSGAIPAEELEKAEVRFAGREAALASAREKLSMLESGATKTELAVLKAQVDESAARLESARARFDETIIRAPFGGVVTRVIVRPGDMASSRSPLLEMIDMDSIVIRFSVPEKYSSHLKTGDRVEITLDAMPGKTFDAEIARVYPELDSVTRTRVAEAVIPGAEKVSPGMFARVDIGFDTRYGSVVVPVNAITPGAGGKEFAFIVKDGKAHKTPVKTGVEAENRIEIIEGIAPGDVVVVAGNEKLKDGAEVRLPKKDAPSEGKEGKRS